MTYIFCKKVIQNGTYRTKEEKDALQLKLDVFLLNDRLTQQQYEELTQLLNY